MSEANRELRKLGRLLDQEREALRGADFKRIESMAPRKLALIERLESGGISSLSEDERRLGEEIGESVRRNQALIAAALEGVRDAQQLLARARLPRRHETYSQNGKRQMISETPGRLERRS